MYSVVRGTTFLYKGHDHLTIKYLGLPTTSPLDTEIELRHPRSFLSDRLLRHSGKEEKEKDLGVAKISVMAGNLWGRN